MTYADPEHARAARRAYYAANREKLLERDRERKRRYGRDCIGCGARTDGANGRDAAPLYCTRCHNDMSRTWTRGTILSAIQLYAIRYGRAPTAADWNATQARNSGRPELAERFYADGDYPQTGTVQDAFGSWNAAIAAAGFEPRGIGKRGPARARP